MKKSMTYLVRAAFVLFVGAIALSPLFTNLAELKELGLTPQGYIPIAFNPADTPTPASTPMPTATSTVPSPANLRITYIEFNPPGDDVMGEYIEVTNLGGTPQDIKNWFIAPTTFTANGEQVLHDPFFFPSYVLNPGELVRVWTKEGINTPPNYFWQATTEIWLNTADIARLFNSDSQIVHQCEYEGGGEYTTCGH